MRISQLAKASKVSTQTIHYYIREGLLPPPTKTAPNMAYYKPEYVDDIRFIKELQEKRYLPLAIIKMVMDAKRDGKDVRDLQDMRLTLEEIFQPPGPEDELAPLTLVELVVITGVPAETLEAMDDLGLLMPSTTPDGKRYDALDVRIASAVKRLMALGLTLPDLNFYAEYVEIIRTEVRVIHSRIFHGQAAGPDTRAAEVKEIIDGLKSSLMLKVYRHAALEHRFCEEEETDDEH
ncbi:MAG: MerR family transcriptional regulator [Deltaproteobacteria bacterium]|nr:MerR family transcriptional regulator [Deltaproteobacteria bacterium]